MILQVRTHQKPQRLIPSAFGKDVRDWLSWTRHNHWRLVELTWTPKKTSDHCWCFRHPAPVWCGKKSFYQSQNFSHQEYLFDFSWNFTLTNRSPQQKIHSTGSILRKFPVFHLWDMGSLNFQNLWGLSFTYFMKNPFWRVPEAKKSSHLLDEWRFGNTKSPWVLPGSLLLPHQCFKQQCFSHWLFFTGGWNWLLTFRDVRYGTW